VMRLGMLNMCWRPRLRAILQLTQALRRGLGRARCLGHPLPICPRHLTSPKSARATHGARGSQLLSTFYLGCERERDWGTTASCIPIRGTYGRRGRHGEIQHDPSHVDHATGHAIAGQGPLIGLRSLVSLSLSSLYRSRSMRRANPKKVGMTLV
jgi:hypothetical protein